MTQEQPQQAVYELRLEPTCRILLTSDRFLDGFQEGYFRYSIAKSKGPITDEEFNSLIMEQLTNTVYQPSCFPGGVALGWVAGMLGYREGDWQVCLVALEEQQQERGSGAPAVDGEQNLFISLGDLPLPVLERLPHVVFAEMFFGCSRQEALTRKQWMRLTLLLEHIWRAQEELAREGTTRSIAASFLYDWELKEVVYGFAHRVFEQLKASVDWSAFDWDQQHTLLKTQDEQSQRQAMQHPATQGLGRRGVRLFDWNEG